MASLGFGDYVERASHRYNDEDELVTRVSTVSRLALHIDGSFRLICGDKIFLAKDDMFNPPSKMENDPDFDWDTFDWDVQGGNLYDDIAKNYFGEDPYGFTVKKTKISQLGDLRIDFDNGFALEVFTTGSDGGECWRFFESNSEAHHIVVSGQGLEEYEDDPEDEIEDGKDE